MLVHLIFVDDTLRNVYSSRVAGKTSKELGADGKSASAHGVGKGEAGESLTATTTKVSLPAQTDGFDDAPPPDADTHLPTPSAVAPFDSGDTTESVALCLAIKDQYADLTEWLTHHYHHLGIRRFYIMDDGSSPPLATRNLSAFLDPRAVTHRYYHPATRVPQMQLALYTECVQLFGARHKWIGFLDADEFLQVRGNETLQRVLGAHDADDEVGAFAVNWVIHSSAGLLQRPDSARKGFVRCIADPDPDHSPEVGVDNEHVKVFVKPAMFVEPINPHMMRLKDGARTVGEKGDTVDRYAWRVPVTRDRVSLHHYATKSKEEYQQKIDRSNGMGTAKGWDWWNWIEGLPSSECKEMTVYDP
jgi:hypothetical protein